MIPPSETNRGAYRGGGGVNRASNRGKRPVHRDVRNRQPRWRPAQPRWRWAGAWLTVGEIGVATALCRADLHGRSPSADRESPSACSTRTLGALKVKFPVVPAGRRREVTGAGEPSGPDCRRSCAACAPSGGAGPQCDVFGPRPRWRSVARQPIIHSIPAERKNAAATAKFPHSAALSREASSPRPRSSTPSRPAALHSLGAS